MTQTMKPECSFRLETRAGPDEDWHRQPRIFASANEAFAAVRPLAKKLLRDGRPMPKFARSCS